MPCKNKSSTDTTDEKILQMLLQDARTRLSDIAGKCGITSSAVLRRIKKLENAGVILGTQLWLRIGTLGYPSQATIGINADTVRLDEITETVKKIPNIVVYCKSVGLYNMFCLIIARNLDELHSVTQRIRDIPGVQGIAINIWIEDLLIKLTGGVACYIEKPKKDHDTKIDDTDRQIIEQLQLDARTSFVEIGKRLNLSHETVRKRFDVMNQSGVIRGCSILVDWSKLGYQGTLFIFIMLAQGYRKVDVFESLKKISDVTTMISVMGPYDIQVNALVHDLREYAKLVHEIQKIPGVYRATACFATFTYFSFLNKTQAPIVCDTLELSEG